VILAQTSQLIRIVGDRRTLNLHATEDHEMAAFSVTTDIDAGNHNFFIHGQAGCS
jgi:hypothetical protein